MRNPYKRLDIFTCVHEAHRGFWNRISVYHILREKKCYPHGCIYFRWRCKLLNKRSKCHRGFTHVGRKCFGCKYFYEEKIHNYPELQIREEAYREFVKELEAFDDWLESVRGKDLEFSGVVDGVKPHFVQKVFPRKSTLSFRGYLLVFKEMFIGREHIQDYVYARISSDYYQRLKLGAGDRIEGFARVKLDQGRLVLHHLKGIQVYERGEPPIWNHEAVLIARETATQFPDQPEGCVQCPFGALVDVEYLRDHHSHSRRQLICLKGVQDYRDCYVKVEYCGLDKEASDAPDEGQCATSGKVY